MRRSDLISLLFDERILAPPADLRVISDSFHYAALHAPGDPPHWAFLTVDPFVLEDERTLRSWYAPRKKRGDFYRITLHVGVEDERLGSTILPGEYRTKREAEFLMALFTDLAREVGLRLVEPR